MRASILLMAVLVAATACAPGNVRLTRQDFSSEYGAGQFAYAGAGRDFRVDVVGNPFGGDQTAFGQLVTEAMQRQHWGPATNFTTNPGPDAREAYRVVMLFNPPLTFNSMRLCGDPPSALPTENRQNGIALYGAFCRGDKALSRLRGDIDGASGPADPAFRALVGQVTAALFPPDRRMDGDEDDKCRFLNCD